MFPGVSLGTAYSSIPLTLVDRRAVKGVDAEHAKRTVHSA